MKKVFRIEFKQPPFEEGKDAKPYLEGKYLAASSIFEAAQKADKYASTNNVVVDEIHMYGELVEVEL